MLTPRHQKLAALGGHERATSLLLEAARNSDKQRDHSVNGQEGNDTVQGLLRDAINETDSQGRTALMLAGDARWDLTEMLLEHEASPYILDLQGRTCLHHAAARSPPAVVSRLLRYGLDPNLADSDGWTPLFWAAKAGRVKNLAILIDAGGNTSIELKNGWTPYTVAVYHGKRDVLYILAQKSGPQHDVDKMQFLQDLKDSKTGVVQAKLSRAICDGCELVSFPIGKATVLLLLIHNPTRIYTGHVTNAPSVLISTSASSASILRSSHTLLTNSSRSPKKDRNSYERIGVYIPGNGFVNI